VCGNTVPHRGLDVHIEADVVANDLRPYLMIKCHHTPIYWGFYFYNEAKRVLEPSPRVSSPTTVAFVAKMGTRDGQVVGGDVRQMRAWWRLT
jgi:hypothetical protein